MADHMEKTSSVNKERPEADLPPPPPPDSTEASIIVSGNQDHPVPPPKESFSKFYEQRQVNELKRLYRHMHPELRKNLENTVTRDLSELLSTDEENQQALVNLDAGLPVEVQSMRWIFENWKLDSIGDHQGSKRLTDEEAILGGNVKDTSLKFQGESYPDGRTSGCEKTGGDQTKGDVKTALWLFETQPLDSLNKIYPDETDVQEAVLKDSFVKGDVKGTKFLFETHSLDEVGRCKSVEENSILQLKSEIEELKGDVKKTVKLFQTEPLCAIRDQMGNVHEIKSICREETQGNSVNTARWLFETQPLDTINKDTAGVRIIRGISLEEIEKGGVNATKWVFETQPLDTIKEHIEEGVFQASVDDGEETNKAFQIKPLDTMKAHSTGKTVCTEDIQAGDVKSTLWLFETQPMETLKGNFEVGELKRVDLMNEEKGDVKQRKQMFETCSLDKISSLNVECTKNQGEEEIIKGDVKVFKNLFETIPLDSIKKTSGVQVSNEEDIKAGNVKANQALFETTPLYAIEDSLGNYHEVTSVSREEVMSGDVKNYKWMFETKQLDQFQESPPKVDIIKGITKQEIVSGDVRTARWLFETQPVDVIHQDKTASDKHPSVQPEVAEKGDVKKCRWLFETQPIDRLCDKSGGKKENEAVLQGDVKSCTWMFETQPLDSLKETGDQYIKVSSAFHDDNFKGVNVKTTKHLFETEPLGNVSSKSELRNIVRYSSRVEIQSGEVSRVKEMFESKPKEITKKADIPNEENIQTGSVNKFTWMFENRPLDSMESDKCGFKELPPEKDIQGGDVGGKKFIFETCSLDQIQKEFDETEIQKVQEAVSKGDVRSCTMLFESKPLYAIQDNGGEFHEVTSVKKEEILKGDVRGAKWLFETKPLDMIHKDEEVFVIRAVTQEDIEKGCVKSARWRFETEPLDSITEYKNQAKRTVDDVQSGDVRLNKQLFESQQVGQKKYVRLVSVSDVQKGNVRTSTWLFENQPIDSLKGESDEHYGIVTVQREDNQKGDVKRCTWLFETQPLDSLKDNEVPLAPQTQDVIPPANVKSTTWLFESTPLDKFQFKPSTSVEETERNVKHTLDAFLSSKIIQQKGIVIEFFDHGNVKMAKYQLRSQRETEILKEERLGGNLQRILLQLLHRSDLEPHGLLVQESSDGGLQTTKLNLLIPDGSPEQDEGRVKDDVSRALQVLANEDLAIKNGIIMEESEKGSVKIIVYSFSSHCNVNAAVEEITKGDVKSTIGNLMACGQEQRSKASVLREENEKGNVGLYKSCIEKGDLAYLKSLQEESEIEALTRSQSEATDRDLNAPFVQPDVIKASKSTCPKAEPEASNREGGRQVSDALKGSTVAESITKKESPSGIEKERLVGGLQKDSTSNSDLQAALLDLRQATAEAQSIQQHVQSKSQKSIQKVQMSSEQITAGTTTSSAQSNQKCEERATARHTASATATAQESQKSFASLQKSTVSTKKVSASEKEEQGQELFGAGQESRMGSSTESVIVDSPKPMKNFLNPFIDSDYKMQPEEEDREHDAIRGDVKAAIRALQNASTGQKEVEKEEVVRGNLTSTLQSLEKSNINVSQGDFKAAMIYRNAGQSYSACRRKTDAQQISCETKAEAPLNSGQRSDQPFPPPPSAAVTGQESHQLPKECYTEEIKEEGSKMNDSVPKTSDSNKASEKTLDEKALNIPQREKRQKPVPPPKPKHLQATSHCAPHQRPRPQKTQNTSSPHSDPTTTTDKPLGSPAYLQKQDQCPEAQKRNVHPSKVNTTASILSHNEVAEIDRMVSKNQAEAERNATISMVATVRDDQASDVPAQPTDPVKPLLDERPSHLSQEVKGDVCQYWETQAIARRKKGVTITESKDNLSQGESHGVVMRVKRKQETEDEKRKRLSVHKDEIMKGNVKAAMDIFENLRKQEELQSILNKVRELEEDTCKVDVRSMRGLFENVQDWIESSGDENKSQPELQETDKQENIDLTKEDTESVSSVELAFEDLEKASTEIKLLKEQTLARLLDIEETIRKALYTVSNLKSDSDIAGLSSLFRESLGTSTNATPGNNIRKISIVSSKSKHEKSVNVSQQKSAEDGYQTKKTELDVINVPSRTISPTSPSFITIESAARKPVQNNGSHVPSVSQQNGQLPEPLLGLGQNSQPKLCSTASPLNSLRQKSVLELKTGPESPKLIGTTVVTEKYEECDQFGNKIIRSKTSTTVTKQSDTQSSSTYEVVSAPPRYEVTASPVLRRHAMSSSETSTSKAGETGVVFVTFGNSKLGKK
ncbi:xin actin-binding repeat-containing protein 1 [Spea bombifrons]|uniref:xin actin-binding repeat-containing protein 1 n=1 Tax=Spea bombifrons TaxID=233779 RepID=UPI00234B5570|nr:xin actin-binding repeat-containing protein 1 [Spea bombifrons]